MTANLTSVSTGIPKEVMEHLHRHHVVTLSTTSFTGMPHADTVVYMSDSRSIFFFAGEGTQMLRNIKDSRRVSFTIDDYTIDWRKASCKASAVACRQHRSRMPWRGRCT